MIPVPADMLCAHNPPSSIGDCMRASIATLLGLPSSEVPHFAESEAYLDAIDAFLATKGLGLVLLVFAPGQVPTLGLPQRGRAFCLLFGMTVRGVPHAVVGQVRSDGSICVWHDPHPSRMGLVHGSVDSIGFLVSVVGASS